MTSGDGCSTDGCRSAQWHSSFLTKNTLCKCRAMLRHIKSLHSLLNAVLKNRLNVQKLPKASHIPGHQRAGIPAAGASAPQSPMLLLSSQSFSKLPLVLRLSARAWPTRAEGKQLGFTPSPHLVKNRAHIGANLQSTQHPVERITGRPLVKIQRNSYSLSCWGSLQIRIFKIRHPNIRLQGTANNAVTRSGSASKELTYKTST